MIIELEHIKQITIDELDDYKKQNYIKIDQLNEWKQKYEVTSLQYLKALIFINLLILMKIYLFIF